MFWCVLILLFIVYCLLLFIKHFYFHVIHDDSKVKCKQCDLVFEGKKKMYNHMRTHKMTVCNSKKVNVNFPCDQCTFTTNRKDTRDSHIKAMHLHKEEERKKTEPLKHCCKICKQELNTRKQLVDHEAEHSNEHECGVCGKTFARKFALTRHLNTIHLKKKVESKTGFGFFEEEEVKKPVSQLECEQCGYKSKKTNNMKRHKETHKVIKAKELTKCDKCEFTSKFPKNVKKHIKTFNHKEVVSKRTMYRKQTN